jgi:AcrR family transcriptional regulator
MATPLRERRRQLLRDEILHAAQVLMAEKGHTLMSMDEVAAKVGISKPTLYSYFATKDELIVKAAASIIEQAIMMMEEVQQTKTPLQRLSYFLQLLIEFQLGEDLVPHPWRAETFQFLCEHEESLTMLNRLDEVVVTLTEEAIMHGEIDPQMDKAIVVRAFYSLVHALNIGHLSLAGEPNTTTIARSLATIFDRGVSLPATRSSL